MDAVPELPAFLFPHQRDIVSWALRRGRSAVFAGTGLANGNLFGENSLHCRCPGGASGHETDKRSAHSPKNCQVLARGLNPNEGGAEMVIFDTPCGGAVFSVGSINYCASLPVDEAVSKITANVLHRFLG